MNHASESPVRQSVPSVSSCPVPRFHRFFTHGQWIRFDVANFTVDTTDEGNAAPRDTVTPERQVPIIQAQSPILVLGAGNQCNLACSYCYRAQSYAHHESVEHLDVDTALAAVRLLCSEFPSAETYSICWTNVSEPFLEAERIMRIWRKIEDLEITTGNRFSFTLNTNGTVWNARFLRFLARRQSLPILSLDGPEAIHDEHRRYGSGKGSFATVSANLARMRKLVGPELANGFKVSAVLTETYSDPVERLEFFIAQGFSSVSMYPPTSGIIRLDRFKSAYSRLADFLRDQILARNDHYLFAICFGSDYFGRLVRLVMSQEGRRIYQCGAGGRWAFYASPNGSIYPCDKFGEMEAGCMGKVESGLDGEIRARFSAATVDNSDTCRDCWAKNICGGPCNFISHVATGNLATPDPSACELFRHCLELAIELVLVIHTHRPDLEDYIHSRLSNFSRKEQLVRRFYRWYQGALKRVAVSREKHLFGGYRQSVERALIQGIFRIGRYGMHSNLVRRIASWSVSKWVLTRMALI